MPQACAVIGKHLAGGTTSAPMQSLSVRFGVVAGTGPNQQRSLVGTSAW